MRIHPGSHSIVATDKVDLTMDMPLAFVNTSGTAYNAQVVELPSDNADIRIEPIQKVLPYQTFDTEDITLFKPKSKHFTSSKDFVAITGEEALNLIQKVNDTYQYIPNSSVTFIPESFTYSVIAKKRLDYKNDRIFNLKVGCTDLDFAKSIIKAFGDAPDKNIAPSNLWVNNKDLSYASLISGEILNQDFVIIPSEDGTKYKKSSTKIKYEDYTEACTPVWLVLDTMPFQAATDKSATMISPEIYSQVLCQSDLFVNTMQDSSTIKVHKLFQDKATPIVVLEVKNKSFVVLSHKSLFEEAHLMNNIKAIYETMFYVYKQCYVKSPSATDWITDEMPDYVVSDNKLIKRDKFLSKRRVYELFELDSSEALYVRCDIDKSFVKVKGLSDGYVEFRKDIDGDHKDLADIKKEANQISVYTARKNIMYFDEFVYVIQDRMSSDYISYEVKDAEMIFTIKDFKHSYMNIDFTYDPSMAIAVNLYVTENYETKPIMDKTFKLITAGKGFDIVALDNISQKADSIHICNIRIFNSNNAVEVLDIRKRGGGLPKTEPDDYNLLDIGHLYGLSYRKAGTICVTLPERVKPHKEIIEQALRKHMSAERYLVLLFKEE